MLDNIGPLAIGAVQHLRNHCCSLSHEWFYSAQTLIQDSRSTGLKHLPLIVWKLDRLGRSLRDLITLLDELKARDVAFRSLTEAIDTTTPTGRAMWQMVGILAELERSLIQERTKAGRAAAQARGVKMGRKPLLSVQQVAHARTLLAQGERPVHVAHLLKVSRRTLERAVSRGGA